VFRFRGGTALNKLHFSKPLRYSEDIDLTRTKAGAIGHVLDRIRQILEPWMGHGQFVQSKVAPKFFYSMQAEDQPSGPPIRVKVEINTRARAAYDGAHAIALEVKNPWFTGNANIQTFSKEEIVATKLRALLQREKGRDVIDLFHAHAGFSDLDHTRVITLFSEYLEASKQAISRAQAEERMFAKLDNPNFLADVRPLLAAEEAKKFDDDAARAAFVAVFQNFIKRIPGKTWKRTKEMAKETAMPEVVED
jgi:predicted nucleotidyltransferase component of viral defense system